MVFELTDSLASAILREMENQTQHFMVDAKNSRLVVFDEEKVDEETFYSLPRWSSADGYNVLESFVSEYSGVKAHDELAHVLSEGRGVFKNFKNVLKKYCETERRFNSFKSGIMKNRLFEWYNELREAWGLENLDVEFEEAGDLVLEDFTFQKLDKEKDFCLIAREFSKFADELDSQFPGGFGFALSSVLNIDDRKKIETDLKDKNTGGFVCRTLSEEFAGCLLFSSACEKSKKSAVITGFFVSQNYRGLGIAGELFRLCVDDARRKGIQFLLIPNSIVPKMLESLLVGLGFEKKDFVFLAELN